MHNVQRSAQNLKELTALGISSKKQLAKIFATTLVKGTEVSRSTNRYGITINKVLNIGKRGQIQTSPQFRSIILCDLLLYIDVTFWYLSIDLGLFWGSWFLHRHKIPHPNQWGT